MSAHDSAAQNPASSDPAAPGAGEPTPTDAPTHVRYELRGRVAWITLVDGDRGNPVHPAMVAELYDAVRRAAADEVAVIVLASTGRFFSVGGDLGAFSKAPEIGRFIDDLADALHRVVAELLRADAVVVALVQGTAAGAGFPLAAAADVVVAARSAKFTLGYTKIGMSIDGGSTLLAHSVGLHRALRLALLNDVLTAQEAYDAGIVARVVDDADLATAGEQVVATLAAGPARAQATVKRMLRDAVEPAPERALALETRGIRSAAVSPDGREGVAAFLEKRPPQFGS